MTGQKDRTPLSFVQSWGWNEPPAEVQEQADAAAKLAFRNAAEIASELGHCDLQTAVDALERRPPNRRDMDWLIAEIPALRDHAPQLYALSLGVEYVDYSKAWFKPAADLMLDRDLARECREYRAFLTTQTGGTTVLVFADPEDLRGFQQTAGTKASTSALRSRFPSLPVALAEREAVTRLLDGLAEDRDSDGQASVRIILAQTLRANTDTKLIDDVHAIALEAGATDIHIDVLPEGTIEFSHRVRGDVERMPVRASTEQYLRLQKFLLKNSDASRTNGLLKDPCDGRYQYVDGNGNTVNVRASFMPSQHITVGNEPSVSMSLRLLKMNDGEVVLSEKGVREDVVATIEKAIKPGQGLVLLVGPTNSGKSTTIAGMIGLHREIYGDRRKRVSAEDPVERFIKGVKQFEVAIARRGKDGFQVLSKNFMRHDPDMIFLGEIRDTETAEYAVHFADSGHLVLSTLHASSPEVALQRLINMLPTDKPLLRQAALDACTLIVGQRLAQRLCPHCRIERQISQDERDQLAFLGELRGRELTAPEKIYDRRRAGCSHCKNSGITGMVPLNQTLVLGAKLRERLLEPGARIAAIAREGVTITFEQMALDYMREGVVAFDAINF